MFRLSERFKVPKGYAIPADDESRLRTVLNLTKPNADGDLPFLPERLVTFYYAAKRCHDLLGWCSIEQSPGTLVSIILAALQDETAAEVAVPDEPQPDFREVVKAERVKMGTLVAAVWRERVSGGYFSGFDGDLVIVQIDGTDRKIPMQDVRLAKLDEFPKMKRNVND